MALDKQVVKYGNNLWNWMVEQVQGEKAPDAEYAAFISSAEFADAIKKITDAHKKAAEILNSTKLLGTLPSENAWADITEKFDYWKQNEKAKNDIDDLVKKYKKLLTNEKSGLNKLEKEIIAEIDEAISEQTRDKFIRDRRLKDEALAAKKANLAFIFSDREGSEHIRDGVQGILDKTLNLIYYATEDGEPIEGQSTRYVYNEKKTKILIDRAKTKIEEYFLELKKDSRLDIEFASLINDVSNTIDSAAFFPIITSKDGEELTQTQKDANKKMEKMKASFNTNLTHSDNVDEVEKCFKDLYEKTNCPKNIKEQIGEVIDETPLLKDQKYDILEKLNNMDDAAKTQRAVDKIINTLVDSKTAEELAKIDYSFEQKDQMDEALGVLNEDYDTDNTLGDIATVSIINSKISGLPSNLSKMVSDLKVKFKYRFEKADKGAKKVDAFLDALNSDPEGLAVLNGFYKRYVDLEKKKENLLERSIQLKTEQGPEWDKIVGQTKVDDYIEQYDKSIRAIKFEQERMLAMAEDYQNLEKKGEDIIDPELSSEQAVNQPEFNRLKTRLRKRYASTIEFMNETDDVLKKDKITKSLLVTNTDIEELIKDNAKLFGGVNTLITKREKEIKERIPQIAPGGRGSK